MREDGEGVFGYKGNIVRGFFLFTEDNTSVWNLINFHLHQDDIDQDSAKIAADLPKAMPVLHLLDPGESSIVFSDKFKIKTVSYGF
jgi:hypothetical protein